MEPEPDLQRARATSDVPSTVELTLLGERTAVTHVLLDYASGRATFVRVDGKSLEIPLEEPAGASAHIIAGGTWIPSGRLLLQTVDGDAVLLEVPKPSGGNELDGRRIVYLDQNMWTTVSKVLTRKDRMPSADRDAVMQLARWVFGERVVLPMSAGHLFETTKWADDAKRRAVALSLLQLTRGWTMRDPLQVRRDELHDLFRRKLADGTWQRQRPVFTLDVDSRWGENRGYGRYRAPSDITDGDAFFLEVIVPAQVTVAMLLVPEALPADFSATTQRWVEVNQQFGDDLDASDAPTEQKRRATDTLLMLDMRQEIPEEAAAARLPRPSSGEPARMIHEQNFWEPPSIGLYREVLYERHVNRQPSRGVRWRPGDLWDMTYLGCAAAYADVVVCERSATHYLTQAIRRRPSGAKIFRSLPEAVDHIQHLLAPDGDDEARL